MVFFSFLSWFRPWWKTTETDYESVLNRLTKDIGDVQNRLITINQRERRASVTLTLYAILVWLAYVLFVWLSTSNERISMSKAQRARLWLPAIVGLLIILSVRSVVRWWYLRVSDGEERHLRSLQRARRKKIDEIKQATRFDHLRSLLERYDDTAQTKPGIKRGPSSYAVKGGAQLQPPSSNSIRGRRQTFTTTNVEGAAASAGPPPPRQFEGMRDGVRVRGNAVAQPSATTNSLLLHGTTNNGAGGGATMSTTEGQAPAAKTVPKIVTSGESLPFDSPQRQNRFQKTWLDRLADKILGVEPSSQEVAVEQRYALICHVCLTHNGLCPKEDWEELQYICPRCGTFNSRRPSSVPVTSPWSPPSTSLRRASAGASVSPARSMHELAPSPATMIRSPSSQSMIVESVSAPSLMGSTHSTNGDADDSRIGDFSKDFASMEQLPKPSTDNLTHGEDEEEKEELIDDERTYAGPVAELAKRRMASKVQGREKENYSSPDSLSTATKAREDVAMRKRVSHLDQEEESVEKMQVD
jgi:hypothetical protein